MKTFKIFLENAAENLEALRANSEQHKQKLMQQIVKKQQQKLEDEALERTINKEIEEREKIKANIRRQKR
jgi:phosphoenolpyruvate-protein kinase (PTS system EI component)